MPNEVSSPWDLAVPLDGNAEPSSANSGATIEPAHACSFRTVAGSTAWTAESLDSTLRVTLSEWSAETEDTAGTVSAWISPLEDLGSHPRVANPDWDGQSRDLLPIVADVYPWRRLDESSLAVIIWRHFHPGLMAKCRRGYKGYLAKGHGNDELLRAQIHLDHCEFQRGYWYHVAIAWDADADRLDLYLNGELAVTAPDLGDGRSFDQVTDAIYVGNPFLGIANVRVSDTCLDPATIAETFEHERRTHDRPLDPGVDELLSGHEFSAAQFQRDEYTLQTEMSLTDPEEVDRWVPYGPDTTTLAALEATPEGMLFETRDTWDVDNLCTLWGPTFYEGDVQIEYEFRIERDLGLALVVFNATTFSRQDPVTDPRVPRTGSMGTILSNVRNYWWEYMRRTPPVRHDTNTQILAKGPHNTPALGAETSELPKVGEWHTLTVNKEGDRIRCAIDGRCIFDVIDSGFSGQGSSYNAGRIALRHMQKTRVRYRNLRVYTRDRTPERVRDSGGS